MESKSKFRNKKESRYINNQLYYFDSKKEAKRFDELYLLAKSKRITDLTIQPEFLLCDTIKHDGVTYPKVKYVADFKYIQNGKTIVEDVKSDFTSKDKTFRVKIKWFLFIYGKELIFKEIN